MQENNYALCHTENEERKSEPIPPQKKKAHVLMSKLRLFPYQRVHDIIGVHPMKRVFMWMSMRNGHLHTIVSDTDVVS